MSVLNKKITAHRKYMKKHPFITSFLSFQIINFAFYLFELMLYRLYGYNEMTAAYPLSGGRTLPFWQYCGTTYITGRAPAPILFCANDTYTYLTPFLRSMLFGIEMFTLICTVVLTIILLVALVAKMKAK